MTLQFKNNASTTLVGAINNAQTSITVTNASAFPIVSGGGEYFYATMYEESGGVEINVEIVKVTNTIGSSWTVVRAQDGTTARTRSDVVTCYVELRLTAAGAMEFLQKSLNLGDIGSASAARTNLGLGSIATQDASNVAITGGSISGVVIESIDSSTSIADNADPTKKVAFEVSGVSTGTTRTLTIPNASGTIALLSDLSSGYQPLDSDLTAIAGLAANGIIARTGLGTASIRTLSAPAAGLTITNPDGVSGNPTFALANDLAAVEGITATGFVRRTATDTWTAAAISDADLPSVLTGKSYNGLTLTAATTGFSLAGGNTNSKTLTVNNSITLAGTDGTTITLPSTTGTVALNNQTFFIGTTQVAINRASAALTLAGVSIGGNAATATSATSATTATHLAGGLANQLAYQTGAGATSFITAPVSGNTFLRWNGTAFEWATVTTGTVSSVDISSTDLTATGGPITTSGSISLSLNTVGIAKGGTGQTTKTAAFDALSPLSTLGDLVYHDGTDNVRLAGNTTTSRRFLRQTGTGTVSAAPAWDGLVDGDIPTALTGKTYNGLTLTAATTGFTVAGGTTSKTLTVSNTLTLAGTDASTLNIGAGGTLGSAAFTASTAYAPAAGSSSITTVGTIGSGTWQGTAVAIGYGGTGASTKAAGFNALSPITTLGDLIYGDGANSNARLAGNTLAAKRFLTQTGNGTVSAAPGWNAIVDGDLPSALTGKTYNGLTLTALATGFTVAGGTTAKTLQVNNNLTLSGTDGSMLNIGGGGTLGSAAFTASTAYEPTITTLSVSKGGTGVGTLTGLVKGNGTSAFSAAVAGTDYLTPGGTETLTNKTYNALTLTAAATGFTIAGGTASKTLTMSNTLTLAGTDGSTLNVGAGGTLGSAAFTASTAYAPAAGSSSITTVGTIASGTWQGTAVALGYGGTGASTAAGARTNLGATTVGANLFTLTNPAAISFLRVNADNTVSALDAATFRTAIGAGTGSGTVTSVEVSGGTTGLTTSGGPITGSGTITLSGTLGVANGGTGVATLTGLVKGNGTSAFTAAVAGTDYVAPSALSSYAPLASPTFTGTLSSPVITATGTSAAINVQDRSNTSNSWGLYSTGSTFKLLWQSASNPGDKLTVDSSGNLSTAGANTALGTPMLSSLATSHVCLPQFPVLSSLSQSIVLACNARFAAPWTTNSTGASGMYSIDGNVHTWNGAASLAANSTITFTQQMSLSASSDLTVTGNVTAYSDERLKKDWDDLPSDFITKLADVKTGTYTRIDNDVRQIGVSAQSLQSVAPEGVIDGEKYLSVAYGNVALAAAVALARKVVELEARLAALEA